MNEAAARAWMWTEYWQGGRSACFDEMPVAARGCLETLWSNYFAELPENSAILDLATGAGEVARLALHVSRKYLRHFEIVGVDLATFDVLSDPQTEDEISVFRLAGTIDITRLPFPSGAFDCAVSQFGVEYADFDKAAAEVARALRPGGQGLFVIHHAESAVSIATKARLAAFQEVIGDGAAFDLGERVYRLIERQATRVEIDLAVAHFNECVQRMRDLLTLRHNGKKNIRQIVDFLGDSARVCQHSDPKEGLRSLGEARGKVFAWMSRQKAQLTAARGEPEMLALSQSLEALGLKTSAPSEVRDSAGILLAWKLGFVKSSTETRRQL